MRRSLRVMVGVLGAAATIYGLAALLWTPRAEIGSLPSGPVDRSSNESTPMRTQTLRDAEIAKWAQLVNLALQMRDAPSLECSQYEGRWPPRRAPDEPWDGPPSSSWSSPPPLPAVRWEFISFAQADAEPMKVALVMANTDEGADQDLTPVIVAIAALGVAAFAFWPRKPRPIAPL